MLQRLDMEQMSSLISHKGAAVPLWLGLACGELRVYGDFRTLTHKIQSLPDSLDGLLSVILDRLINEDETGQVKQVQYLQ